MKIRKVLALLLVLVMVFAFSVNALAVTPGTVDVVVTISGAVTTYPSESVDGIDDTVYDVADRLLLVDAETFSPAASYSPLLDPNDPLYGLFSQKAVYVTEFAGMSSKPYEPLPGAFDEWDEYVPDVDPVLEAYNDMYEEYGGIYMYYSDGYFFFGDMQHMLYIGEDTTYAVDFADDGPNNVKGLPVDPNDPFGPVIPGKLINDPAYDNFFMYAMNECLLSDGDTVYLTYGPNPVVFTF